MNRTVHQITESNFEGEIRKEQKKKRKKRKVFLPLLTDFGLLMRKALFDGHFDRLASDS